MQSEKSVVIALFLCVSFGILGVHRFYVGKVVTCILQLCTFGGLGIWVMYDTVMMGAEKFEDKNGHLLLWSKA